MQFPAQRTGVFLHFLCLLPEYIVPCRLLRLEGKVVIFLRIYRGAVLCQHLYRILPVLQVPVRHGHALAAISIIPANPYLVPVAVIQDKVIITAFRDVVECHCYVKVMLVGHSA